MQEFDIGPWVRDFPRESGDPHTGLGRNYAQDRADRAKYLEAVDLAMLLHYTGQRELDHRLVVAWHTYLIQATPVRGVLSQLDPSPCLRERRRLAEAGLLLIAALAPHLLEEAGHGV